jgi:hypothetical protein
MTLETGKSLELFHAACFSAALSLIKRVKQEKVAALFCGLPEKQQILALLHCCSDFSEEIATAVLLSPFSSLLFQLLWRSRHSSATVAIFFTALSTSLKKSPQQCCCRHFLHCSFNFSGEVATAVLLSPFLHCSSNFSGEVATAVLLVAIFFTALPTSLKKSPQQCCCRHFSTALPTSLEKSPQQCCCAKDRSFRNLDNIRELK